MYQNGSVTVPVVQPPRAGAVPSRKPRYGAVSLAVAYEQLLFQSRPWREPRGHISGVIRHQQPLDLLNLLGVARLVRVLHPRLQLLLLLHGSHLLWVHLCLVRSDALRFRLARSLGHLPLVRNLVSDALADWGSLALGGL